MKYLKAHDNGNTRGIEIGRFGGLFYLHVYYGIAGHSDFRWHIYLQIDYPRIMWLRTVGKRRDNVVNLPPSTRSVK